MNNKNSSSLESKMQDITCTVINIMSGNQTKPADKELDKRPQTKYAKIKLVNEADSPTSTGK